MLGFARGEEGEDGSDANDEDGAPTNVAVPDAEEGYREDKKRDDSSEGNGDGQNEWVEKGEEAGDTRLIS